MCQGAKDGITLFQVFLIHKTGLYTRDCYPHFTGEKNWVPEIPKPASDRARTGTQVTRVPLIHAASQSSSYHFPPPSVEILCTFLFSEAGITQRSHSSLHQNRIVFPPESGEWDALWVGQMVTCGAISPLRRAEVLMLTRWSESRLWCPNPRLLLPHRP